MHDPGGTLVSQVPEPVPSQKTGISYGQNGAGAWVFFREPTPGEANPADGIPGFVEEVTPSLVHGFFEEPQSVVLSSATPDTTIRYTLDGSPPSSESPAYDKPLEVTTTTVLRAKGFHQEFEPSGVTTATYLFPMDVAVQSKEPPGFPARWKSTRADYEMDSNASDYARAAGNEAYSPEGSPRRGRGISKGHSKPVDRDAGRRTFRLPQWDLFQSLRAGSSLGTSRFHRAAPPRRR